MNMKQNNTSTYTAEQITEVFDYLKNNNQNLYVCALLAYGCSLRPDTEIRLLKINDFNEDYSELSIGIRKVTVPLTLQEILKDKLSGLSDPEANIFTLTSEPLQANFFNFQWVKVKEDLKLKPEQNLNALRQTAAVNLYWHTGNLKAVQQFMGHSTTDVTEKYLRALGCSILPEVQTA